MSNWRTTISYGMARRIIQLGEEYKEKQRAIAEPRLDYVPGALDWCGRTTEPYWEEDTDWDEHLKRIMVCWDA